MPEIVFFHHESHTLILTDLIMDFDPSILSRVARVTTRWNQMYRHTPRGVQLANFRGRLALRRTRKEIQAWQAEHVIVAHSPWLCVDGREECANYWTPPSIGSSREPGCLTSQCQGQASSTEVDWPAPSHRPTWAI